jgi:hypothetical protein
MKNATFGANAPSMPSRRAALGSIIAAGAALAAPALLPAVAAAQCSNQMAKAIALHRLAWDALGEACNRTDEVLAEREGRVVTQADELAYRAASDAEDAAQDRIFRTPISSLAEMSAFVAWATWLNDGGEDLSDRFLETMRRAPILAD